MTPFDRISVSLTVIRRLQHVLTRETQALRSMQIAPLADLQPEKATLVDAYAAEVRHLRASPELFAALDDGVRESFATATRELQSTITTNVRALESARGVMEGVVRILGDSLRSVGQGQGYLATGGQRQERPKVLPVAFSREI
ncbi:MAG: hypothetical protein H6852_18425 [Geminicoccaceae bacterium]|jgi:hypothetical protein|nr:hypothetical protein [Geminicoccaceae bacterium]MCB9969596.1 hypothetical protein [Geminicoccaceae bacterium]